MNAVRRLSLAPFLVALSVFAACGDGGDPLATAPAGDGAAAATVDEAPNASKAVALPADPFFAEFAYPGTAPSETLTLAGTTTAWFETTDDFSKVSQFYAEKSAGGANHIEQERAYFTPPAGGSGARTITVTAQPDGSTQIILNLESS